MTDIGFQSATKKIRSFFLLIRKMYDSCVAPPFVWRENLSGKKFYKLSSITPAGGDVSPARISPLHGILGSIARCLDMGPIRKNNFPQKQLDSIVLIKMI